MRRAGQGKKLADAARLLARGELHFTSKGGGNEPDQDLVKTLAALGLEAEPAELAAFVEDPPFHLWPEHVPALDLWGRVQTQWRMGFDGATGLDYAGVEVVMRRHGVPRGERDERFAELQVMERAALAAWSEKRAASR